MLYYAKMEQTTEIDRQIAETPNENKTKSVSFDEIYREIGEFGLYQILVGLSSGLAFAFGSFSILNFIFGAAIPNYRYEIFKRSLHFEFIVIKIFVVGVSLQIVNNLIQIISIQSGENMQFPTKMINQNAVQGISTLALRIMERAALRISTNLLHYRAAAILSKTMKIA